MKFVDTLFTVEVLYKTPYKQYTKVLRLFGLCIPLKDTHTQTISTEEYYQLCRQFGIEPEPVIED